jgi:hypothetical protein
VRHLDGGQHPVGAVVGAALDDGVQVRPEHDRGQVLVPGPAPDQVGRRVDLGFQPGLAHPARDQLPALALLGREREPGDAARIGAADLPQLLDVGEQTPAVDVRRAVHGRPLGPRRR